MDSRGSVGGVPMESLCFRKRYLGAVSLDVAAAMERGTVLVPVRVVAEALGGDVKWNAGNQQVLVMTQGSAAGAPPGAAPGAIVGPVVSVNAQADPPTITVRADGIN